MTARIGPLAGALRASREPSRQAPGGGAAAGSRGSWQSPGTGAATGGRPGPVTIEALPVTRVPEIGPAGAAMLAELIGRMGGGPQPSAAGTYVDVRV